MAKTAWEFDCRRRSGGLDGNGDVAELAAKDGLLLGRSTGRDPVLQVPGIQVEASRLHRLSFRMRSDRDQRVQVFWATTLTAMNGDASLGIEVLGDGQFHDYEMDLAKSPHWRGMVSILRIDPATEPDVEFAFDYIRLRRPGRRGVIVRAYRIRKRIPQMIGSMSRVLLGFTTLLMAPLAAVSSPVVSPSSRPNIVVILADDLGYGDVGCYNDRAKVATPNLDRLAREGMRFTDAHSPATVCTPSRYSLMTGQMAFRVPRGGTVFTGVGGPSLISPGRLTLPAMLRAKGYATACVGKWHIGLTFFDKDGQPIRGNGVEAVQRVDFSRRIEGGPLDHGFDRFFGTACCPTTDWLYAFIEGDRVPVPPAGKIDKTPLPKHPYANDCRAGVIAPNFPMEEIDLVFLEEEPRVSRVARPQVRRANRSSSTTPRRPCICRRSPRTSSRARPGRPARRFHP